MELRDLEYVVYEVLGKVRDDEVPLDLEVERGLERATRAVVGGGGGRRGSEREKSQGEKPRR